VRFKLQHKWQARLLCGVVMFLCSCKYTKHLTDNQTLLKENKIILKTEKPVKNKGILISSISSLIEPQPNTHLLDVDVLPKFKLWKYNNKINIYGKDSNHPKIAKHKVEWPALVDSLQIRESERMIRQFMINQGYYYNTVSSKIIPETKAKTASVEYTVDGGKMYYIRQIRYESENKNVLWEIEKNKFESFLKPGDVFTNFKCGNERDRLYKILRNVGYYDFKTDNISFLVDTINRNHLKDLLINPFLEEFDADAVFSTNTDSVDVKMIVRRTKDSSYATLYRIRKVMVEIVDLKPELNKDLPFIENEYDNIFFKYKTLPINRNVIARNIFVQAGDAFNTRDVEATVSRLNQLGVFQFINFKHEKVSDSSGWLDCFITVNMAPRRDIVGLTDISTSDGDYLLGLGAAVTYRNKNLLFGGNQLSLKASYSTEFRNDKLNSGFKEFYQSGNNVSLTANITFPKFIVPFKEQTFSKRNMPFTILGLNYSFIQRLTNYSIINITGSFGYSWKETQQKSWRFNPAFLTVTRVPERFLGEAFKAKLDSNAYLQNIFSNNIIYGENATLEYMGKTKGTYKSVTSMRLGFEEAGTILQGINAVYKKLSGKEIQPIAWYARVDADVRRYTNSRKIQWVNRAMIGIGIPVGNTSALPYIKQYSAGGSFSNRGWVARTLGPGRSVDSSYKAGFTTIDRTGDMKLEANSELRFNVWTLFSGAINLKGAAFVDAGNIWLYSKNSNIKGGEFNPKYFYRDLAVSAGIGARFDFSFFVFRIDHAYPLKQPQYNANNGWAFDILTYESGVWNIAIGYPF